ncbi:hypothetical protein H9P43_001809 [Blastocladiella emersonii ATCC 22665]|nr:hypothetical protein H9P43_001809 [Blastocladiella emersonii ATCC 22665]
MHRPRTDTAMEPAAVPAATARRPRRRPTASLATAVLATLAALFLAVTLLAPPARAHSIDNPGEDLLHYELLTTAPRVEVVRPGRTPLHKRGARPAVHADDHLRVALSAFNRTFHLHLRPDTHLVHPQATVTVHRPDGSVVTKPLTARVYRGRVVENRAHSDRLHAWDAAGVVAHVAAADATAHLAPTRQELVEEAAVGTASLVMEHDGLTEHDELANHYPNTRKPVFYAHFDVAGEQYKVTPLHAYAATKRPNDPEVAPLKVRRSVGGPAAADATMLIYRASDTVAGRLGKRAAATSANPRDGRRLLMRDPIAPPTAAASSPSAPGECGAGLVAWNRDYRKTAAKDRARMFRDAGLPADLVVVGEPLFPNSTIDGADAGHLQRRQASRTTVNAAAAAATSTPITSPAQCISNPKFVYMGVASDCMYSAQFGNSESQVLTQLINVWSQVSAKYQTTFNVGVGIVSTEVRLTCGKEAWNRECSTSFSIQDRLGAFSQWRGTRASAEGLWHLMSTCNTGTTLGIAWTGTVCQTKATAQSRAADPSSGTTAGTDYVSGTGVSTLTRDQWKVVAHEVAHNFGAVHDCISSQCSAAAAAGTRITDLSCCPCSTGGTTTGNCDCGGQYIMNPTDNSRTDAFSPCSVSSVCGTLQRALRSPLGGTQCLQEPGAQTTLQGKVCGNGILEEGEQCDCGTKCDSDACCTKDCKFKAPAVCSDTNNPGCCAGCQFKPAGTVCRDSQDFCDVPETCSGTSAVCPTDAFREDGLACKLNGTFPDATRAAATYCASGMCTSRSAQCFLASKGQTMVFQTACSAQQGSCSVSCADPSGGNACYLLDSAFFDGTECGLGGRCRAGQCSGSSLLNSLSSWLYANPTVTIVVAIILGLSVLSCLYSCCVRKFCDKMRQRKVPVRIPAPPPRASVSPALDHDSPHPPPAPAAPASTAPPAMASAPPAARQDTAQRMYEEQQAYLSQVATSTRPSPPPAVAASATGPTGSPFPPPRSTPVHHSGGSGGSAYAADTSHQHLLRTADQDPPYAASVSQAGYGNEVYAQAPPLRHNHLQATGGSRYPPAPYVEQPPVTAAYAQYSGYGQPIGQPPPPQQQPQAYYGQQQQQQQQQQYPQGTGYGGR